jgi:hypothetical protein
MDKLKHVEAADLGYDELSDDEEAGAHVHIKGAATARRTRVLKGVKLDKTFEPPSHYMCARVCSQLALQTLIISSDALARWWMPFKSRSTTWTATTVISCKSVLALPSQPGCGV